MGRQSSRIYYQGKDHKDIFFQNKYHQKMYKGSDLVWEKLYRYFVDNSYFAVFDFDSKKYISERGRYLVSELKKGPVFSIASIYDYEERRYFFAISYDMLQWKEVKDLEYVSNIAGKTSGYIYMSSQNGFFVYHYIINGENKLYFVEIDYGLEYTVKEVYSPDVFLRYFSQYGVSDYFYGIQHDKSYEYILYRIWKNGKVESGRLMGNFIKDNVGMDDGGIAIIADENGNAFLVCYDVGATNGGTVVFKVENMDTELVYTTFWARTSDTLNGSECGIDIIYDSYQTMFLAHRGYGEEKNFIEGPVGSDGYYNMEFWIINSAGNVIRTEKKRNHEINIKCFGIPGRSYLTIKFEGNQARDHEYISPEADGYIYFQNIRKGITSSKNDNTSCVFDYDKTEYSNCFVGNYNREGREYVIYIENLYTNESDGNFVVAL